MTQIDGLSDALAATSLRTDTEDPFPQPSVNPAKASFASALQKGKIAAPSILPRGTIIAPDPTAKCSSSSTPTASCLDPPSPDSDVVQVDDTILQAMRKKDDRIFFSQYENQMSAFVRDATRSTLELGAMNTWQRLLMHRCADQFQLEHQLDRATHCITLSKTPNTSHPSVLLSTRAREYLVHRNGIDPVGSHLALADPTSAAPNECTAEPFNPSASASSRSSPAPNRPIIVSAASGAPPAGFKIMRRDPSSSRQSRLLPADTASGNTSDSDKSITKARKDMTLEEREASYKAARARIFADLATSSSPSPTSSSTQLDLTKDADAHAKETKPSPSSSAASSPVASIPGGRSGGGRRKVPSSSSSVASHDGSSQRARGSGSNGGRRTMPADADDSDDLEFRRNLHFTATSAASPFGAPHQSSPLAFPGAGQGPYGYPVPAGSLQQSQSNPNLRSGAPAFQPGGSSTPAYAQGGALRFPDMASGTVFHSLGHSQTSEMDAFPALPSNGQGVGQTRMQTQQHQNAMNMQATGGGVWNRGQENALHGVGAWAQQTSAYAQMPQTQRQPPHHPQYQQPQNQPGFGMHMSLSAQYPPQSYHQSQQYGGSQRNANGSRASSQRGGHRGARDDAMSVSSVTSTASSRSTSFSGAHVAAGNATANSTTQGKGASGAKPAVAHPSLPARPAWIGSSSGNTSVGPNEGG